MRMVSGEWGVVYVPLTLYAPAPTRHEPGGVVYVPLTIHPVINLD